MHQKTKEIIVPCGEQRPFLLTPNPLFTDSVQAKKNSVSCSEFHLVQNGLNLRKMRFSANFPSSYTNINIGREFGSASRKKQSNFEAEESFFTANVFVIPQN